MYGAKEGAASGSIVRNFEKQDLMHGSGWEVDLMGDWKGLLSAAHE